jgi:hypothetical protein
LLGRFPAKIIIIFPKRVHSEIITTQRLDFLTKKIQLVFSVGLHGYINYSPVNNKYEKNAKPQNGFILK